ncbi:MAG: ABC transporter substrate-binding protein [Candidatus Lokiarchaeota archaeon]|nr:ABC transporter substrate-binding protein [Candidatus Lokiarchaeota archaeon]
MSTEHKTPKKRDSSKKTLKTKLKEIRKPLFAGSIIIVAAVTGIIGGFFFINQPQIVEKVLICGTQDNVFNLDPLYDPHLPSIRLIDQVAEGLFDYDQSKAETPLIYNLATEGEWSPDYLNFTCSLRRGVQFHDGTPFNAEAVKWSFDRINRFMEIMPYDIIRYWVYMYTNSDGHPIINRTEVLDTYTVRFVLNKPYIPFPDLLTARSSYILSPTSTPSDEFIPLNTNNLIGTGPYKLYSCISNVHDTQYYYCFNSTLKANRNYWNGEPYFDKIIFIPLRYLNLTKALESEQLSFSFIFDPETLQMFKDTPGMTLLNKTDLTVAFIGMNNDVMNVTMRKAISYAFNYTYYFDVLNYGEQFVERARSPLSKEMRYSNWEAFSIPYYNITLARQTLINANWNGTTGLTANDDTSPGNPWELKALSNFPLATYNITYPNDSWRMGNYSLEIARNLRQIGVKGILDAVPRLEWYYKGLAGELDFDLTGYYPTLNDPVDMLNPQYSNKGDGSFNIINFNDTLVQQWLDAAIEEPNTIARKQYYYNIQERLIEELYPCVWLGSPITNTAWDSRIKGMSFEGIFIKILYKHGYY